MKNGINEQNLKPQANKLTVEELSRGGKASVKSRRTKRTFRELTEEVLSAKNKSEELKAIARAFGINDPDNKVLTILGMVKATIGGNANAFDRLLELSEEKIHKTNGDKDKQAKQENEEKQNSFLKAIEKAVKSKK